MYAINENMVKINGVVTDTFERDVVCGQTALAVEAGTTGYKGSAYRDNGGRTYISIDCLCGDFNFSPVNDTEGNMIGVKIACCGDDGLNAIMHALEFAQQAINDQRCHVED